MTDGTHVLLAGRGAEEFARDHAIEFADPEWFATPERRRQWEEMKAKTSGWFDAEAKFGTVGAVACDAQGHVAAATSTGGLTGKRWGRIGDSPVIGAGTYADDRACAVRAARSGATAGRSSPRRTAIPCSRSTPPACTARGPMAAGCGKSRFSRASASGV